MVRTERAGSLFIFEDSEGGTRAQIIIKHLSNDSMAFGKEIMERVHDGGMVAVDWWLGEATWGGT